MASTVLRHFDSKSSAAASKTDSTRGDEKQHSIIVRFSRFWFVVSGFLLVTLATKSSSFSLPPPSSPLSTAATAYTALILHAQLDRANLSWSLLFHEQQQALRNAKKLSDIRNMIACYGKHGNFNRDVARQLTLQNLTIPTNFSRTRIRPKSNSSQMITTRGNKTSNSSQVSVVPNANFLANNGSSCLPDLVGGRCFPPHSAGSSTPYYYQCMDDVDFRRGILEFCPDYTRYSSKPAYAARFCSSRGIWSAVDNHSVRRIRLANGTVQATVPCLWLLEKCYTSRIERDSNTESEVVEYDEQIIANETNIFNENSTAFHNSTDVKLRQHVIQPLTLVTTFNCTAARSDTVVQIEALVFLLDLIFSSTSFAMLCVTIFIFVFFKSLHCGRISIHTNLAASLLLRTSLHIMFMAYKIYLDRAKQRRNAEQAALNANVSLHVPPPAAVEDFATYDYEAGFESNLQQGVNHTNFTQVFSSTNNFMTTPASAALLLERDFTQLESNLFDNITAISTTLAANSTQIIRRHAAPVWRMSDALCKCTLAIHMYATVASVFWMFIEGFHLSQRIAISVFERETKFFFFYIAGWLMPLMFVLPWVLAMELTSSQNKCYCWSNYYQSSWKWVVAGPMIGALSINAVFLIGIVTIVITKLQASHEQNAAEVAQIRKALKATIILFPLLGVSFLFSAFNPNDDGIGESAYFISNAVLQGSQGIFVAVIYCFCNSEVKHAIKLWYYRILLRRGDYRRSSRIAMSLVVKKKSSNTTTTSATMSIPATSGVDRRKSSSVAGSVITASAQLLENCSDARATSIASVPEEDDLPVSLEHSTTQV